MRREVENLRLLHDAGANVPAVIEDITDRYGDIEVELYVVMEYILGETLAEAVQNRGVMSFEKATAVIRNLCETIVKAHELNVYHRDLKPDNIIVRDSEKPDLVLIDFGLSFNDNEVESDPTRTTETFRNKFLDLPETNTPGGDRRDPRSDITAVVGVLYFCLTGHSPRHLTGATAQQPHMRKGYAIRERLGGDPRLNQLELLFDKGFSQSIDSRFQTLKELLDRLQHCLALPVEELVEDPIQIAQRVSHRIRERDRATQLREMGGPAHSMITELTRFATTTFQGKLDHIQLSHNVLSNDKLPDGFDEVPNAITGFAVNPAHNNEIRAVAYRVGAKGSQCVVFRHRYQRHAQESNVCKDGAWEEVLWYQGDSTAAVQPIVNDFKKWLNSAMLELEQVFTR